MPLKQEENPLLTADFFQNVVMRCVTPLEEKPARSTFCFKLKDLFLTQISMVRIDSILLAEQTNVYYLSNKATWRRIRAQQLKWKQEEKHLFADAGWVLVFQTNFQLGSENEPMYTWLGNVFLCFYHHIVAVIYYVNQSLQ